MEVNSSLGFKVVPKAKNRAMSRPIRAVSDDRSYATASGSSEGFRSAHTSPVTVQRPYVVEDPSSCAVSVDSSSFHTPESYTDSNRGDDDNDSRIDVEVLHLDNADHYKRDQPKLLLAENGVEGRERKQPLDGGYRDHSADTANSKSPAQVTVNQSLDETTPLLQSPTGSDDSHCCCLLM